ncbi:hypothetical protein Droror1_Dr00009947 [Drosera rotundifolia]
MASPPHKPSQYHHYAPLPPSPPPPQFILLPFSPTRRRTRRRRIITFLSLLTLSIAAFILWPSGPQLRIARLTLRSFSVRTHPRLSLDVSLAARVDVRNTAIYSLDFGDIEVEVWYRGERLGHVTSKGGHVRARGRSWVDAIVEFDGVEVVLDWVWLVEDLGKGVVRFDTVSWVSGELGLFGLVRVPIQSRISCEVDVNTRNQTVMHQNCYPE